MNRRNLLDSRMSGGFIGRRRKIKPQLIMGAVFLLAIPLVATSLASQVTISGNASNGAIEFGQGNQVTVACDTSIQTSVGEIWSSSQTNFIVDTITLSGLNNQTNLSATTSNQGCGGKTLKVSLFNTSNVQTPIGSDSSTVVSFVVPTSDGSLGTISGNGGGSNGVTGSISGSGTNSTVVMTIPASSVNLLATNVGRVALESQ